jgi:mono/diheme cytochrome c family protein
MKKLIVLLFICAAGVIACGKKIMPESDTNNPSKPVNEKTEKDAQQPTNTNTSSASAPSFKNMEQAHAATPVALDPVYLDQGKSVFLSKCGSCHALKKISDYKPAQWTSILKAEIPKAKLTSEESGQVTAFIMAKANK